MTAAEGQAPLLLPEDHHVFLTAPAGDETILRFHSLFFSDFLFSREGENLLLFVSAAVLRPASHGECSCASSSSLLFPLLTVGPHIEEVERGCWITLFANRSYIFIVYLPGDAHNGASPPWVRPPATSPRHASRAPSQTFSRATADWTWDKRGRKSPPHHWEQGLKIL